jgi:phosphoribosylamine-glycine ligase
VLYAGLMLTAGAEADRIQRRFGDPECQVLMMRLETDLVELLPPAPTAAWPRWSRRAFPPTWR